MSAWSRGTFLSAVGGFALSPRVALAQPSERTQRLCWPSFASPRAESYNAAFIQRLHELGHVDGRNLVIDFAVAGGRLERQAEIVGELARRGCDVWVAPGNEQTLAAVEKASRDTPIIMVANDYDPVATGHIASLAQPGGRITGVAQLQSELPAKRLELLRELLPRARKVAVFTDGGTTGQLAAAQEGARRLGLALHVSEFKTPPYDYERAFADAARAKSDALLVFASAHFVPARRQIPALALKHRLPSIFGNYLWAEAGALLSYGPNFSEVYRRAAEKTSQVLKGAKPATLPVEEATAFELVINLKTMKALGIAIPPPVRLRADRVIE
jgi:putative tryptophan/tyrosine transport system substrate-binding protein